MKKKVLKKKILLISPPFTISLTASNISKDKNVNITGLPLGLMYLGTVLQKEGHEVKIIDGTTNPNFLKEIYNYLPNTDFVGLSVMTPQIYYALLISRKIKEKNKKVKIMWGGAHSTLYPFQTIKNKYVDIVIVGEGEETIKELVSGKRLRNIDGIFYKEGKRIIRNKPRKFLDMNKLPLLNWDIIDKKVINALDIALAHTSRGCPHRCTFCINSVIKNYWRSMSPEKVIEQLKDLKKHFKNKPIYFRDEEFFINIERAHEICRRIIKEKLNIKWLTSIRADHFRKVDMELLKESGCYQLHIGSESGSQRVLDFLKKDIKVEDSLYAAEQCKKYDILPKFSFMIGLPTENEKEVLETINLIDKIKKINQKATFFGPTIYRPQYPSGELYEVCNKMGWKAPDTLEEWAVENTKDWSFISPEKYPWIDKKDIELLQMLEPLVRFGTQSLKSDLKATVNVNKVLKLAFSIISKIRWKLKIFKFPIEYRLAMKFLTSESKKRMEIRRIESEGYH